jgi:conserved hypothetical protein, ribA/ribD-fused
MDFKYYQYKLGTAELMGGEMHASLHEIVLDDIINSNPFLEQVYKCITGEKISAIIKKHILRGINIGDEKHTRLISAPDFPLKTFEPGYFNSSRIDLGLSGGDFDSYKPDLLIESYYYFWETIHPFSQWHKCAFEIDGLQFNSAEQFMMHGKAILFSDFETAEQILKSKNVREQKQLGRQVKGFDNTIWELNAPSIVYKGNKEKFKQSDDFLNLLFSTKGKTIVEASPDDKIWGIGLTEHQEESKSLTTWKGTNWLGIVLTELREELIGHNFNNGYCTINEYKSKQ